MPNQLIQEKAIQKEEIPEPPAWNVMLHNDDYTPHSLVVGIIAQEFNLGYSYAVQVMLQADQQGMAIVCNIAQHDLAEAKCRKIMDFARANGFPLTLTVEKA